MAQIAVEKKAGFPWWAWLGIALIALGVIWLLFAREGALGERFRTESATPATGAITSLATIAGADDPIALVGLQVALSEPVRVLSVTGDAIFWAGPSAAQQVLVFLQEIPPSVEGRFNVNPGQMLTITGDVRKFPGFEEAQRQWNADPKLRAEFENQKVYIHADRVNITHRP